MNVFDYTFAYVTEEGRKGTVRADSISEAKDKVMNYCETVLNVGDAVKWIVKLSDCENDYGVITDETITEALKKCEKVKQFSFDIYGDIDCGELYRNVKDIIENIYNAKLLGCEWQATWSYSDYIKGKAPISSN